MDDARIYVVWHPKVADGQKYAAAVFDWFRLPNYFGIPVHYRSRAPGQAETTPRKPIALRESKLNLIVLLADENMVSDPAWRKWLVDLAGDAQEHKGRTQFYPVALDGTAYNLPEEIRRLNYITLSEARGRSAPTAVSGLEEQTRRLLKKLTEAFARVLLRRRWEDDLPDAEAAAEPPKVRVFLSHSKRDGSDVARALRDYIYQQTQLSAFFDESDIAMGGQFAEVLETAVRNESAALIAVQSASYAHRPWCRREIQLFRAPRTIWSAWHRPRQGKGPRRGSDDHIWVLDPLVVVEAMQGDLIGRTIPEFGSAPVLRWEKGQEALCIDTLLRETILRNYHLQRARRLFRDQERSKHSMVINWAPDPMSICALLAQRGAAGHYADNKAGQALEKGQALKIIYPEGGLSGVDLDTLTQLFKNIDFQTYGEATLAT